MDEIKIIGDSDFIKNTQKALKLIKERDPNSYRIINNYIDIIKQNNYSGMDVFADSPTFLVGESTSNSNSFWYASCILHDATHSFLFFTADERGEDGALTYQGHDAEIYCLTKQIELLKAIDAPQHLIDYANSLYNNNWYDVPTSKRKW